MYKRLGIYAAAAILGLAAGQAGAATPTGLRVYAELWNPTQIDGESLVTLENQPTLISDTLNQAWIAFSGWYVKNAPAQLFGPDRLHSLDSKIPSGISLYSRSGNLKLPPEVTLPQKVDLTLTPQGANGFTVDFHVPTSTISLCSTTPSADVAGVKIGAGQYADPCATLSVDLDLNMTIVVSNVQGHLLQVISPRVTPSNFQVGNGNWTVQIAEVVNSVNSFFGGTDFQQLLTNLVDQSQSLNGVVQGPVDSLNHTIATYEQTALARINRELSPLASLSSLIHLALWEQNSARGQMLTVLFAPPASGITLGSAVQSGQISGMITFDAAAQGLPASCAAYNASQQFTARAQIGPRAVTSIGGDGKPVYGAAPTQPINIAFSGGAMQGHQCSYTLSHLALGVPNTIDLDASTRGSGGASQLVHALNLQPDHWTNPVIVGPGGLVLATGTPANRAGGSNIAGASDVRPMPAQSSTSPFASLVQAAPQPKSLNLLASFSATAAAPFNAANPQAGAQASALNPAKAVAWGQSAGGQPGGTAAQSKLGTAPSWGSTISAQRPPAPASSITPASSGTPPATLAPPSSLKSTQP
jgi:hypothetical protein